MSADHTPGPWTFSTEEQGRCVVRSQSTGLPYVAQVLSTNARLIAAAPDLLAVCSAFAEDSRLVCNLETGETHYPITPEEMGAIRRAIAKAKGTA